MAERKALQFGAGGIGRGFLGQLLYEGGCRTTFADADGALVQALRRRGEYPLRLVSGESRTDLTIRQVQAVNVVSEPDAAIAAFAEADLVGTSVGVSNLPRLAPLLAAGIAARAAQARPPINIFLCENQWRAAALVRGLLQPHLAPDALAYFERCVGLVETVIGRMVPAPTEAVRAEDPLLIVAEPYGELPVARSALRGPIPSLPGLILADRFEAYEARKLFLHNMSHAALAYLGHARGHTYIWQCAADPAVAEVCAAAITEVRPALAAEYGFDPAALSAFADDLMTRFANRALGDTVARVAADPLRKLRPQDRLVGAAQLCLAHDIPPHALAQIIAAALRYAAPGEALTPEAACGLPPGSALSRLVQARLSDFPATLPVVALR